MGTSLCYPQDEQRGMVWSAFVLLLTGEVEGDQPSIDGACADTRCCDISLGPSGNESCWHDGSSYARCCAPSLAGCANAPGIWSAPAPELAGIWQRCLMRWTWWQAVEAALITEGEPVTAPETPRVAHGSPEASAFLEQIRFPECVLIGVYLTQRG